jgi:RNA polymerase sigma-70 factor (ECF subfamily)
MTSDPASKTRAEEKQASGMPSDPAEWLELHGDALYRFARAKVGRREIAEDLVQETLLAALQSADRFRGDSSPRTWLLAILRRKIADFYGRDPASNSRIATDLNASKDRSSSRFFDADGHWLEPPAAWKSPLDSLEDDEFWIVFNDCVAHLPQHLAQAFIFREIEGMDVDRLRSVLEVGAANLRVRLHRARLLLRACLEKNWFETEIDESPRLP